MTVFLAGYFRQTGYKHLIGGLTVFRAGDFHQRQPVVPRGNLTQVNDIKACLKKSAPWLSVEVLKLTKNMRVHLGDDVCAGNFSACLLRIGNGIYYEIDDRIFISEEFCTVSRW